MSIMKKKTLLVSVLAILLLLTTVLGACGSKDDGAGSGTSSEEPTVIRVGTMVDSFDSYMIAIGQDQGIFEKYGLIVEDQAFGAGILTVDALALNEVDFGMAADFAAINRIGNSDETNLRVYARETISNTENSVFYSVSDSVKTPADLGGKSLPVNLGTVEEYYLARLLEVNNIPEDSVNLLPVSSGQEALALVAAGDVDALLAYGQTKVEVEKLPNAVKIGDLGDVDAATQTILVSNKEFLEANQETVIAYLKALDEIGAFIEKNPEESAEIVEKILNTPAEQVASNLTTAVIKIGFDQESLDALNQINTWAVKAGFYKRVYEIEDYLDLSAVTEAFPDRVITLS